MVDRQHLEYLKSVSSDFYDNWSSNGTFYINGELTISANRNICWFYGGGVWWRFCAANSILPCFGSDVLFEGACASQRKGTTCRCVLQLSTKNFTKSGEIYRYEGYVTISGEHSCPFWERIDFILDYFQKIVRYIRENNFTVCLNERFGFKVKDKLCVLSHMFRSNSKTINGWFCGCLYAIHDNGLPNDIRKIEPGLSTKKPISVSRGNCMVPIYTLYKLNVCRRGLFDILPAARNVWLAMGWPIGEGIDVSDIIIEDFDENEEAEICEAANELALAVSLAEKFGESISGISAAPAVNIQYLPKLQCKRDQESFIIICLGRCLYTDFDDQVTRLLESNLNMVCEAKAIEVELDEMFDKFMLKLKANQHLMTVFAFAEDFTFQMRILRNDPDSMQINCQVCELQPVVYDGQFISIGATLSADMCTQCCNDISLAFSTKQLVKRIKAFAYARINEYAHENQSVVQRFESILRNTSYRNECIAEINKFLAYIAAKIVPR